MSAHKKTITSISWHPRDTDVIASSSADREIVVWNIPEQKVIARINQVHDIPTCIEWCPHEKEAIAFTNGIRPLYIWHCPMGQSWDSELISHKETFSFHSGISYFAWSPKKTGKIAFGHNDGSISVLTPGEKAQKHVCKPEPADGEGSDEENFVQALQWDPLSNDYLLVANAKFGGMRLIDTTSASVITNFKLPSAAAKIKSFSWIPTAPGMFVTGGMYDK